MNKKVIVSLLTSISTGSLLALLSSYKMSYIVGSYHAFFTPSSALSPLVGMLSGLGVGFAALIIRALFAALTSGHYSFMFLVYHTPGICAAAYWRSNHYWLKLAVPIICMLLFWSHPIGRLAFPYALYWLIPIIIVASNRKTIFLQALATTFIAHAIGSVLWLYTTGMSAQLWYALIPVVAVERLLFATLMTTALYAINTLRNYYTLLSTKQLFHLQNIFSPEVLK